MDSNIFSTSGLPIGFHDGRHIYDLEGRVVGRLRGAQAYCMAGHHVGELRNGLLLGANRTHACAHKASDRKALRGAARTKRTLDPVAKQL